MQISSVGSAAAASSSAATTSSSSASSPAQALGINDFMKLLATQFQEQDPLKPMDDTAFIAQTAQFTALQQATTLTQNMSQMAANSYIGRQVTVNSNTGQTAVGTVTAVDTSGTTPQLIINGAEYPLANVLQISPPPAPAPTTTGGS